MATARFVLNLDWRGLLKMSKFVFHPWPKRAKKKPPSKDTPKLDK